MKTIEKKYLKKSIGYIFDAIPKSMDEMLKWYEEYEETYQVVEINSLVYCLFSYPVEEQLEQLHIFVYDKDTLVADCSSVHGFALQLLVKTKESDYICDQNDWMFIEHDIFCNHFFLDIPYSHEDMEMMHHFLANVLFFSNTYVTTEYRKKGIFTEMIQMSKDYAIRSLQNNYELFSLISLDPDIACYGPDASDEPYYYSYEKDEPQRERNRTIMEHIGFTPYHYDEMDTKENLDGTKIWFGIQYEKANEDKKIFS